MKRHLRFAFLAPAAIGIVFGLALWGCGSGSSVTGPAGQFQAPPAGSGAGLLAVEVESFGSLNGAPDGFTAAPADSGHGLARRTAVSALYVTFDSLRVYPACEDSVDGRDCGYFDLLTGSVTVNVADLDSTLTEVLGTLQLPTGDYTHLALHLADAWVVTDDGDSVTASLPGGSENWLKVMVPFSVQDGEVTVILISFDLDHSLVEAPPGSLNFKIKPVLHGHLGCGQHHDGGDDDGDGGGHGHGRGNGGHEGGGPGQGGGHGCGGGN